MGVPTKFYTFVDSQADAGKLTAARLNGDFDPLYACLDPAQTGLEDTNVKAGAKIVCTDRAHTVTGVWTFTTAPVFPDASIADAKLSSNVMLKTTYDTNANGVVENAVEADTVDGQHASAFAVASYITSGTLDGDRLPTLSETKKGGVPATGTPAGKYLRDDGTWVVVPGYVISLSSLTINPADGTTYYFGNSGRTPQTAGGKCRAYIPKAGTIKVAYVFAYCDVVASGETVSVYIRKNDTTDTLVQAAYLDSPGNNFTNAGLSISVSAGDYIEIKVVCPTFATNPTGVYFSGVVYIE